MDSGKIKAFIIGPIGDRDADEGTPSKKSFEDAIETFENIIEPACTAMDLEAFRADHINRSGDIHDQIYRSLRDSHVVIADLTGANPNVMYELGLRHTTGKLTFQIGERDRLPFDVSTIRTILFKRTAAGFVSAKRALIAAIAEGLEQGADPVAATRVWFEISSPEEKNNGFSKEEIDLKFDSENEEEEPGFLEKIADTESGITEIAATLDRGTAIITEIGNILHDGAKKIQEIPQAGNYSALKLNAANSIAQKLEDPAIRLKMVSQDYKNHVKLVTPGMEYMLAQLANDPKEAEEARDFIIGVISFAEAAESSSASSEDFVESLEPTGNATRMMTRVTKSIKESIASIGQTSKKTNLWKTLAERIPLQNTD